MNTPPFLLGATLLFWGWETGFVLPGLLMALVLESSRWVQVRWDISEEDFSRIWIFCTLLFLGTAIYAFTANEGPADFRGLLQNPTYLTQRNAGAAGARTAAALVRWLPMIFFFFIAAQVFSSRQGIPLETISLIMRLRWKRAQKQGLLRPPMRSVDISYAYLGLSLLAACSHNHEDSIFFWGLGGLVAWTLWAQRSRRFSPFTWATALATAFFLGYGAQRGLGQLQRYFDGLNSQWLASFTRRGGAEGDKSKTSIGQIGRIKTSGKIVIRLEPRDRTEPPALLREASYRKYKFQWWYAGTNKTEFENIQPSLTTKDTWVLQPGKTNLAPVSIACYLDRRREGLPWGLLPLADGSGRLEKCSAYNLYANKTGAVLAEGPGLVMYEDWYGPGRTIDLPAENLDKEVNPLEKPVLNSVINELQLTENQSPQEILHALGSFFQSKFAYSTWQAPARPATTYESPLARFLTETRSGHCEYFATATVLLLRQLNIPARYAIGYLVHEKAGKSYVVRERDAHAWCLVWNQEQQIWENFDTTPTSWIAAEASRASPLQFLSDAWSRMVYELAKLRWGQSKLREYFLWALIPILGVLLFRVVLRSRRHRRSRSSDKAVSRYAGPGLDSEFYQLETRLAARGIRRRPSETLSAWLARASAEPAIGQERQSLEELLVLHYRYRFDPRGLQPAEREALRSRTKSCLAGLARGKQSGRWATLSPLRRSTRI
jgi:hypothetical protein